MISDLIVNSLVQAVLTDEKFAWPQTARGRLNRSVKAVLGTAPEKPLGALVQLVAECDLRAFDFEAGKPVVGPGVLPARPTCGCPGCYSGSHRAGRNGWQGTCRDNRTCRLRAHGSSDLPQK